MGNNKIEFIPINTDYEGMTKYVNAITELMKVDIEQGTKLLDSFIKAFENRQNIIIDHNLKTKQQ